MCSFNGLHVEVAVALGLDNGSIATVRKGTRMPVAKTGQVVLVTAEILSDGLGLEGAVAEINNTPNNVVLYHFVI